jgi:hypothetical protein
MVICQQKCFDIGSVIERFIKLLLEDKILLGQAHSKGVSVNAENP